MPGVRCPGQAHAAAGPHRFRRQRGRPRGERAGPSTLVAEVRIPRGGAEAEGRLLVLGTSALAASAAPAPGSADLAAADTGKYVVVLEDGTVAPD